MIYLNNKEDINKFVKAARSFMNVPWKHRGRSRHGMDCGGLVVCSLKEIGYEAYDLKVYGREPFRDGLRSVAEENFGDAITGEIKVGDILLLKFLNEPHHVAIVGDYLYGGLSLIHSYGEVGKVVETRLDETWINRIKYIYRMTVKE